MNCNESRYNKMEWPQLKKWESAFLYDMTTVLDDVINEIKTDRKKNPQLALQF